MVHSMVKMQALGILESLLAAAEEFEVDSITGVFESAAGDNEELVAILKAMSASRGISVFTKITREGNIQVRIEGVQEIKRNDIGEPF